MKNITIVLQRSELNYLINYDSIRISSDRIINFSYNEFKQLKEEHRLSLLQNSLPIFEQDHEVILMEYESSLVSYDNAPVIEFNGISSIIPLTAMGSRLLSSKLNTDFNILDPLDSNLYKSFINNRNHSLRIRASKKLCEIYNLSLPNEEFITDFRIATLFQINDTVPTSNDSTMAHLIAFNVTPSFIPEGNIEALIKSACVGMKKLGLEVEQIKKSTFYKFAMEEKEVINKKSLFLAIQHVEEKTGLDEDEKTRFSKLKKTLSENDKYDNAFLLFSYFYSLKKEIEKRNYDISAPKNDILELKHNDSDAASKVLFMLGYTFSIQTISKSIQSFSNSALLKTQKNLDLEWTPIVVEDPKLENKKLDEDEKAVEIDLTVKRKNDEKTFSNTQDKGDELESEIKKDSNPAEKTSNKSRKEIPVENKDISINKSKISDTSKSIDGNLFSNSTEIINKPVFSFQKFEKSLKKRKAFLSKIVNELKSTGIPENEITKQILIKCLIEIDEYEKQKGGLKVAAKDALNFFE